MRSTIITLLILPSPVAYSQETCVRNVKNQYSELTKPISVLYHENGQISHMFINRTGSKSKTFEWDSCGHLIEKKKSSTPTIDKRKLFKHKSVTYHSNGKVKSRSYSKRIGCIGYKRGYRREYDEDDKRMRSN